MENEKDLLKKDLGSLETKEEIEKFAEDAEFMGHEDIANLAREKIAQLETKVSSSETTPLQTSQVENLGGHPEDLAEKTKEIDEKIEEVKSEAAKQIENISEATVESEKGSPEEALHNLNQVMEKSPAFRPDQNDKEEYESLMKEFEALPGSETKEGKKDKVHLFNLIQDTYEYVKKVTENPKLVTDMKNTVAESLNAKGDRETAEMFSKGKSEKPDITIEKAKFGYAMGRAYKENRGGYGLSTYLDSVDEKYLNDADFLSAIDSSSERTKLQQEREKMKEFLGNKDKITQFFENKTDRLRDWFQYLSVELKGDKEFVKKLLTENKDTGVILMNADENLQNDPEIRALAFNNYNIGNYDWDEFKKKYN